MKTGKRVLSMEQSGPSKKRKKLGLGNWRPIRRKKTRVLICTFSRNLRVTHHLYLVIGITLLHVYHIFFPTGCYNRDSTVYFFPQKTVTQHSRYNRCFAKIAAEWRYVSPPLFSTIGPLHQCSILSSFGRRPFNSAQPFTRSVNFAY